MPPLNEAGSPEPANSHNQSSQPNVVTPTLSTNVREIMVDRYEAQHIPVVAELVRIKERHKIRLDYYHGGLATSPLAPILRKAYLAEREHSGRLQGRAQRVFAQRIFMVIVGLLAVWDSVRSATFDSNQTSQALDVAIAAAEKELEAATEYAETSAKKSALAWYLCGLPAGALAGWLIILMITNVPRIFVSQVSISISGQVALSFGFGAVGAIVSVMIRITRGSNIEAADHGRMITMLGGAFRPIIGAVFGAMFYVLVSGGLLAFQPQDGANESLFFAGIAFLAGFSERWAQDTIVQSAPTTGNPSSGKQGGTT